MYESSVADQGWTADEKDKCNWYVKEGREAIQIPISKVTNTREIYYKCKDGYFRIVGGSDMFKFKPTKIKRLKNYKKVI